MSAVAEASTLLRQVAEPRPVGDTVKQAINRAARRVSKFNPMSAGRCEDIWRQEARAIRAEEMDAIRAAARRRDARETAETVSRLRSLHAAYAETDPDLFGPQMEAIERFLGDFGGREGSGSEASGTVDIPEEQG